MKKRVVMRLVSLVSFLLFLNACSDSDDRFFPNYPDDNSIKVRFIDENGKDASDVVNLVLNDIFCDENGKVSSVSYKIPSEDCSYSCYIDDIEVPFVYEILEDKFTGYQTYRSIIGVTVFDYKDEKSKIFFFHLISKFLIHKDLDSEHLYIFDYRFRLPALLGNQENSIKVSVKAKDLWFKKYEQVTFNGEEIYADENGVFDIIVPSE